MIKVVREAPEPGDDPAEEEFTIQNG